MTGTRFKLIGECVVALVKAQDAVLRKVLPQLKQLSKIKRKKSRSKKQRANDKRLGRAAKQRARR